jgi:hypothetical protein
MEEYESGARRRGTSIHDDPYNRLSQRPQPKRGGGFGGLSQDLGSSLTSKNRYKTASQESTRSGSNRARINTHDVVDSDDDDEMDFLSQASSRGSSVQASSPIKKKTFRRLTRQDSIEEEPVQEDIVSKPYASYQSIDASALSKMKFKKTKAVGSTNDSGSKENKASSSRSTDIPMSSGPPPSSQLRLRPQQQPQPAENIAPRSKYDRRPKDKQRSVKKPDPTTFEESDEYSDVPGGPSHPPKTYSRKNKKIQPEVIDVDKAETKPLRRGRSRLDPPVRSSQTSVEAVVGEPGPGPSTPLSKRTSEFPVLSPLMSDKRESNFPFPSPLSSPTKSSPVKPPSSAFPCPSPLRQDNSGKHDPFPRPSPLRSTSKTRTKSAKENKLGTKRSNVKPHPMSTQITSDLAGSFSARGKRSSEGGTSDSDRESKRLRQQNRWVLGSHLQIVEAEHTLSEMFPLSPTDLEFGIGNDSCGFHLLIFVTKINCSFSATSRHQCGSKDTMSVLRRASSSFPHSNICPSTCLNEGEV